MALRWARDDDCVNPGRRILTVRQPWTLLSRGESPVTLTPVLDSASESIGAARDLGHGLALEDHRAADPALADEARPLPLRDQLDHLDAGLDRVADLHRRQEPQGLRDINGARAGQPGADDCRDQAGGVEPVRDAALER